jgi:hypothetical protein
MWLDDPSRGQGFFCNVQAGCGGTPSLLFKGTRALSQSVKWPKHEAYYSSPSNAEIRIIGVLLPLPIYVCIACTGTNIPSHI